MTALGAFRDDVYNAINVLTNAQFTATAQAAGVLSATAMASAVENYVASSVATALTTDTATNIIAQLQQAVALAYKSTITGFGASVNPPLGVPNLFNLTFFLNITNTNGTTLTLTGGTGVTLIGTSQAIATANERSWIGTVTSPTTITLQSLGLVAVAP
jgi:hypothetical protein